MYFIEHTMYVDELLAYANTRRFQGLIEQGNKGQVLQDNFP